MGNKTLDDTERRIVEFLYADAMSSPQTIAEELSIPASEVEETISDLRDRNFIGQPVAIVDPVRVGYDVASYHFISSSVNFNSALREQVVHFPDWDGTQLALVTLGDYDLVFRKVSTDDSALDRFGTNVLSNPEMTSPGFQELESLRLTQRVRWRGMELPQQSQRGSQSYDLNDDYQRVLRLLQADSSLREDLGTLASKANVDRDDAKEIVKHLEDNNVIVGYSYPVNFQNLNWYRAIFGLSTKQGGYHETISAIQDEEPLDAPYISSGLGFNWSDIIVELTFGTVKELDEITDRLWGLDQVKSTRTYFGTQTFYFDESVPIPQ